MVFIPTAWPTSDVDVKVEVKNKTILYQDTVLNLKDLGENIKISSLYVREEDLQECLDIVLKNNSDVVFNTIQYSKNDQKVYFYTNEELDFSEWYNRNKKEIKPLDNKESIINGIENAITTKPTCESISLNKYMEICSLCYKKHKDLKEEYERKIESTLNASTVSIFSYSNDCVKVYVVLDGKYSKDADYKFKLLDDDIQIIETEGETDSNIMQEIGVYVKEFLHNTLSLCDFYDDVSITIYGYHIWYDHFFNKFYLCPLHKLDHLNIEFDLSNNMNYEINCNSLSITEYVNKNINKIKNNFTIPVTKLPSYVRNELQKEEERRKKEEKKKIKREEEKRLEALKQKEQEELLAKERQIKYEEREIRRGKYIPFYKYFKNKKKDNK